MNKTNFSALPAVTFMTYSFISQLVDVENISLKQSIGSLRDIAICGNFVPLCAAAAVLFALSTLVMCCVKTRRRRVASCEHFG